MNAALRVLAAVALAAAIAAPAGPGALASDKPKMTAEEKKAEQDARLKIAAEGLEKLYAVDPKAKELVEKAPGYAVFDISAIYALLLVGQKGKGVLFNNQTKKPTFMLSSRAGTGPGVGKQRVFQIFVFKSKGAMDQFVLAGGLGGDVSGSASTGTDGMVRSFNPQIDIYQITISGMAVQASWGGTVYKVDSDLK